MAFVHGKNAYFAIGNSTNTLTSIKAFLEEIVFPQVVNTGETTTFGAGSKTFIAGLGEAKFTVKGKFDSANVATASDALLNGTLAAQQAGTIPSVLVEYGPAGNTAASGNPKFTFSVILMTYEVSAPVGDVVSFSLEGQVTGVVTRAVY